jgi:hypothetical protein
MHSHCFFVKLIAGSGYTSVLQIIEVTTIQASMDDIFPVCIESAHCTAILYILLLRSPSMGNVNT